MALMFLTCPLYLHQSSWAKVAPPAGLESSFYKRNKTGKQLLVMFMFMSSWCDIILNKHSLLWEAVGRVSAVINRRWSVARSADWWGFRPRGALKEKEIVYLCLVTVSDPPLDLILNMGCFGPTSNHVNSSHILLARESLIFHYDQSK